MLERERIMDILVGYGFGPRAERILRFYWENISMVARAGLYYGALFKGHWGSPMEIPSPTTSVTQ